MAMHQSVRTVLVAGGLAGLLSGIPSTVHLLLTQGDLTASLLALVAMVTSEELPLPQVVAVAGGVHFAVSFGWASVLVALVPRRAPVLGALVASALIAVLDLRLIAPYFFPDVAALAFVPQLADHLAWGATVGVVLRVRYGAGRDPEAPALCSGDG
jgi:drug/metabolite transporter superfamily protein YnfA